VLQRVVLSVLKSCRLKAGASVGVGCVEFHLYGFPVFVSIHRIRRRKLKDEESKSNRWNATRRTCQWSRDPSAPVDGDMIDDNHLGDLFREPAVAEMERGTRGS